MVSLVTKDLHHASCAYDVQTNFRNKSIPGTLYVLDGFVTGTLNVFVFIDIFKFWQSTLLYDPLASLAGHI